MRRFILTLAAVLFFTCFWTPVNSQETTDASSVTVSPQEAATAVVPEEKKPVSAQPEESSEAVIIDDFLPEGSTTEGTWGWDTALKYSGERSHTEPPAKGLNEHSFRAQGIYIPKNSVIEQYVYLDPVNIPKGILIKFRFEKDGKEGEIGIYREGEEEVFVFNNDEPMLYDGTLPNAGNWEKLLIYPDDLGLDNAKVTGISFAAYGGKAYWDLTLIRPIKKGEQYPQAE